MDGKVLLNLQHANQQKSTSPESLQSIKYQQQTAKQELKDAKRAAQKQTEKKQAHDAKLAAQQQREKQKIAEQNSLAKQKSATAKLAISKAKAKERAKKQESKKSKRSKQKVVPEICFLVPRECRNATGQLTRFLNQDSVDFYKTSYIVQTSFLQRSVFVSHLG